MEVIQLSRHFGQQKVAETRQGLEEKYLESNKHLPIVHAGVVMTWWQDTLLYHQMHKSPSTK